MNIKDELAKLRKRLLDTSLRNRLLNFRESRARTIQIIDEKPEEILDILVTQGDSMEFLPTEPRTDSEDDNDDSQESELLAEEESSNAWRLPSPDISLDDKYTDQFLQTKHEESVLQKRLVHLFKKSQEVFEEQGYPVLYLALGFLKWHPARQADMPRQQ